MRFPVAAVAAVALLINNPAEAFHPPQQHDAHRSQHHPAASSCATSSPTALSVGGSSYLDALQESCDAGTTTATGTPTPIADCAPALASYVAAVTAGTAPPSPRAGAAVAAYLDAIAPRSPPGSYEVGEAEAGRSSYGSGGGSGSGGGIGITSPTAGTGGGAAGAAATGGTDPAAVTGYLTTVSAGQGLAPPPSEEAVTALLRAIAAGSTTPRAAFPSSMAHEFSRARMGSGGGNVGYESRRPYNYGRQSSSGLNGMAGSGMATVPVVATVGGMNGMGSTTALAATATPTAPVVPSAPAAPAAPAAPTSGQPHPPPSYTYPRSAHSTSLSAEISHFRSNRGTTVGIDSRQPHGYTAAITENQTLQARSRQAAMVDEVCETEGPQSEACRMAVMATYQQATEPHAASMGQEMARARSNDGNTVGYESRQPHAYTAGISGNSMLSALEEVCDAGNTGGNGGNGAKSAECQTLMAKYSEAREAWPSSMAQEFRRGRTAQGTVGYESRKPKMYNPKGANYSYGSSPEALLAAVNDFCDVNDVSPECLNAKAAYQNARAGHPTSMSAELARARSSQGTVGIESRQPTMYTAGISENAMLSTINEVCDADSKSEACQSAIASYSQATETHSSSMGAEFSRARSSQGTVGYESRKPTMYTSAITNNSMLSALDEICDADSNSEACQSAIASYNQATETHAASMGQEFSRARSQGGTVGYQSRTPTMYQSNISPNSMLSALDEICDADSSSEACQSAIASYNQATETHTTSMGQEFSRARSNQGTVGYDSRTPTMYQSNISPNSMLSAIDEVCDADVASEACQSAIAAYNQATETHAGSMGQEFARARSNQGNTVGYESRKPTMYSSNISNNSMLSAIDEVCDADASSEACQQLVAQYNDAKEPWASTMSTELTRGRTSQGTVGYESRKPAMYTEGRGSSMFDGNMGTQSLLAAANEVCDADSSSVACANAIAAYNDARASWSTNMSDEFARGTTTSAAGTTVGYPSRTPDMYRPAANTAGISENTMLSTKPAETYVYALNEYCQPQAAGTAPSEDCAQAITGYLDAVGAGAAEPLPQIGAGIGSYLDSIAPASAPKAGNSGAAVSSYLDSVAAGATSPPSVPAVKSYLEDVSAGAVTTPSTSGSMMSYLETLGN